mmetsp:Transcript_36169/g.102255  ORF Transcript_36169/g.102255 Transcript_36169/m.102255 type:complete len:208 (-) Transcript_36169:37-660(-)
MISALRRAVCGLQLMPRSTECRGPPALQRGRRRQRQAMPGHQLPPQRWPAGCPRTSGRTTRRAGGLGGPGASSGCSSAAARRPHWTKMTRRRATPLPTGRTRRDTSPWAGRHQFWSDRNACSPQLCLPTHQSFNNGGRNAAHCVHITSVHLFAANCYVSIDRQYSLPAATSRRPRWCSQPGCCLAWQIPPSLGASSRGHFNPNMSAA